MKFTKTNDTYVGTRKDGQVIRIEKAEEVVCGNNWVSRYDDDFYGDNTEFFKTLKEAKAMENNLEARI